MTATIATKTLDVKIGDRIKLPVGGTRTVEAIVPLRRNARGVTHEIQFVEGGGYNATERSEWLVVVA